jgi:hypothetical protein
MALALGSPAWEDTRVDALFLALGVGFFALTGGLVRLCERL